MLKKESTYAKIIHWLVMILFTGLFAVGVFVTGWNFAIYSETVWIRGNDVLSVFVALLGVWLLLIGVYKLYDKVIYKVNPRIITPVFAIICYGISATWILCSQAIPQADQLTVYNIANDFNVGLSEPLTETSYIVFFPYQLGIVSFLRILIKIFGYKNYLPVQLVFALCSPLIVFAGSGIIRHLVDKEKYGKVNFFYGIACLFCLPMHLYTTFIYGDLPFAALSLVMVWLVYSILDRPKVYKYILLFLVSGANYLFKTNALIVVLAISIFLIISLLKKDKRWVALIALLTMLSGVYILNAANQAIYSKYIPEEYSSLPFIASVVMGMNDDWGRAGWCNFYHQNVFTENECDPVNTKNQCLIDMRKTLGYWAKHPAYTINFFYRKINLQWNAPLYQGVVMNSTHETENLSKLGQLVYDNGSFHIGMQVFAKVYQLALYGIITAALWIKRKKVGELKEYVPMIVIFGSFLFSLMWEAKTRYQMPAFIMMLPCFALSIPVFLDKTHEMKNERLSEFFTAENYERKRYNGIDLFKMIMALVVVAIHVLPHMSLYKDEGFSLGEAIGRILDTAVPFFFMAAGFLLAEKMSSASDREEKVRYVREYLIRMIKLYVIWNIVHLPFYFYYAKVHQYTLLYMLYDYPRALLLRGSIYNAYTLWYLLSSIYASVLVLICMKKDVKKRTMLLWAIGFVAMFLAWNWIVEIGDPKNPAALPYGKSFEPLLNLVKATTASGRVFLGMFYLPLGMLLSKRKATLKTALSLIAGGLCIVFTDIFADLGVVIIAIGIFTLSRVIKLPDCKLWKWLRNISTGVYFTHLIVWTVIYMALYGGKVYGPKMYVLVCIGSILVSAVYFAVINLIKGKNSNRIN